jgi:hypothetical protein
MKPTAVEFAVEQLEQLIPFGHQLAVRIILEQALEMEKQQIIDAYWEGSSNWIMKPKQNNTTTKHSTQQLHGTTKIKPQRE